MAFEFRLPYYSKHIPYPLPSKEEILASPHLKQVDFLNKVAVIGDRFIIKYGLRVNLIEAENLIYVKETTRIPVPCVYAVFSDPDEKCNYIIMEYVPGITLLSAWPKMTEAQKHNVSSILKGYFEELRSIPSPGYYGCIGRRQFLGGTFSTSEGAMSSVSGPFDTEAEFTEAMTLNCVHSGASKFKADFYRRVFRRIFNSHPPVFTHADLQRRNIMVDFSPNLSNDAHVTLVDWEAAGWYPSCWEYSVATYSGQFKDDWSEWLEKILEPYDIEFPYIQMLYTELWA